MTASSWITVDAGRRTGYSFESRLARVGQPPTPAHCALHLKHMRVPPSAPLPAGEDPRLCRTSLRGRVDDTNALVATGRPLAIS